MSQAEPGKASWRRKHLRQCHRSRGKKRGLQVAKLGSWDFHGSRPVSTGSLRASLFLAVSLDTNLSHCLTDEAEKGRRIRLHLMALNFCPLRPNLIQVHGVQYAVISLTFHDTEGNEVCATSWLGNEEVGTGRVGHCVLILYSLLFCLVGGESQTRF